jgi:hypothetical protein
MQFFLTCITCWDNFLRQTILVFFYPFMHPQWLEMTRRLCVFLIDHVIERAELYIFTLSMQKALKNTKESTFRSLFCPLEGARRSRRHAMLHVSITPSAIYSFFPSLIQPSSTCLRCSRGGFPSAIGILTPKNRGWEGLKNHGIFIQPAK